MHMNSMQSEREREREREREKTHEMDLVEKTETRARTSRTYPEQLWPLWLRHVRRDLKRATGRRIVSRVVTVVR